MISYDQGEVTEVLSSRTGITEVTVKIKRKKSKAINYDDITGDIRLGDKVVLNTTAIELDLGSGNQHYVMLNLRHLKLSNLDSGHIMKLRYTPLQMSVLSVEEQKSPHHRLMKRAKSLSGMPVIAGSLHSQLPAVAATIKYMNKKLKVAYLMTDGGALPLVMSNLVSRLKALKLIDSTITTGHAFGGDLEAINIFSGLVAAKKVAQADIAIVIMGPGIVGTDSALGFTGMEQAEILNAATSLDGTPIAIPRISFKDKRKRHQGISHHTLNALSIATLSKAVLTVPEMDQKKTDKVFEQLKKAKVSQKHEVKVVKNPITLKALAHYNLNVTTMGRTIGEEPDFFKAAGASAIYAVNTSKEVK